VQKLRKLLSEAVGIAFVRYTKTVFGAGGVCRSGFTLARLKKSVWLVDLDHPDAFGAPIVVVYSRRAIND